MSYFERLQQDYTPQEWRFWERNTQINKNSYGGATHDNNNLTENPIRDIMEWNCELAMLGYLPDTFNAYLSFRGIPKHKHKTTTQHIISTMKKHTHTIFKKYWKLTKDKTKTIPPTTQIRNITEATERPTIHEDQAYRPWLQQDEEATEVTEESSESEEEDQEHTSVPRSFFNTFFYQNRQHTIGQESAVQAPPGEEG